jgi:Kef-type K+ transport system membrane component KefB
MQLKRKKRVIFSSVIIFQAILILLYAYKLIYKIYESVSLNFIIFVTSVLTAFAWLVYIIYFVNNSKKDKRPLKEPNTT